MATKSNPQAAARKKHLKMQKKRKPEEPKREPKNLETKIQRKNSEKEKICENVKYLRTQGNPITS